MTTINTSAETARTTQPAPGDTVYRNNAQQARTECLRDMFRACIAAIRNASRASSNQEQAAA